MVSKTVAINKMTHKFGMMTCQMSPAKKIVFKVDTKYRAGTIYVITCMAMGMLFISKIKPDNKKAGKNAVSKAIWAATN